MYQYCGCPLGAQIRDYQLPHLNSWCILLKGHPKLLTFSLQTKQLFEPTIFGVWQFSHVESSEYADYSYIYLRIIKN